MKTVKAGLLGLGTVGGGVYKLIEKQKEEMGAKTGAHVEIAGILVYNLNKKPFNAVFVHRDAVDDVMFYGRGAGELPTASAVMGDVIDVVRNIVCGCRWIISRGYWHPSPVYSAHIK